ncbi:uncharacterized protein AKAME5_000255000 [Lates japonicus]|uniref:Uncharacterized protein n=1 Tax=Lates japonicus TaxID=270547 RepID=A0AAD3M6J3_LATJO|nr:uncharacterized protein AKAME5_000255000 [Lates japonicus]
MRQQGGGSGGGQPPLPVPEQDERCSRSKETTRTSHNRFNTLEMRRTFAIPTPGDVPNITTFYRDVIGIIQELADEARSQARHNDVIQLEVVGENVRNHVAVTVDDRGILKEGASPQQILMNGSKILSFEEPDHHLKFIDSLSFLPTRLKAMPKALGFTNQTKGYFLHKFSSKNRLNYVGPYPPPSDYGVERMVVRKREEFDTWYGEECLETTRMTVSGVQRKRRAEKVALGMMMAMTNEKMAVSLVMADLQMTLGLLMTRDLGIALRFDNDQ